MTKVKFQKIIFFFVFYRPTYSGVQAPTEVYAVAAVSYTKSRGRWRQVPTRLLSICRFPLLISHFTSLFISQ